MTVDTATSNELASPIASAMLAPVLDAISYTRVSRDITERSCEEQSAENHAVCGEKGWHLMAEFSDTISASEFETRERENYPKVVAALATGRYGVLILWETSRGDREIERWVQLLKLCRKHGVLIHVTSEDETYDVRKPKHYKILINAGADNAYASAETSKRVRRTAAQCAVKGLPFGRIAIGLERVYDPITRKLIEQRTDQHAPAMVQIFKRIAIGEALCHIAEWLNDEGVPSAAVVQFLRNHPDHTGPLPADIANLKWSRSRVRVVATNLIYIAKRRYQGQLLDVNSPLVVSDALFWEVQRKLTDPERVNTRPGKAKYLLTTIAWCRECGEALRSETNRSTPKYVCSSNARCVAVAMERLDEYAIDCLCELLALPDVFADLNAADDSDVVAARGEAERYRAELNELAAAKMEGKISLARFCQFEEDLLRKVADAEKRSTVVTVPPEVRALFDDSDGRHLTMEERFRDLSVAGQRDAIRVTLRIELGRGPDQRDSPDELDEDRVTVIPAQRKGEQPQQQEA